MWGGRLALAKLAFGPCSGSARGPWLGRAEPMPAEPMPCSEANAEAAGGAACRDAAVPASLGDGAGARAAPGAGPGAGWLAKAARRRRAIATRPMRVRVCAASVRRSLESE